jgi:hypothetical protein
MGQHPQLGHGGVRCCTLCPLWGRRAAFHANVDLNYKPNLHVMQPTF